jgi:hypothetical protein
MVLTTELNFTSLRIFGTLTQETKNNGPVRGGCLTGPIGGVKEGKEEKLQHLYWLGLATIVPLCSSG